MSRALWPTVKRLLNNQMGFTLAETLVALGIMTITGSALVGSLHLMNTSTARGSAQLATEADLMTSMQWLSRDLRMAQTADLVDGALPVSCATKAPPCLTLRWTDQYEGVPIDHVASYALVGTELRRTYSGTTHVVARNVAAVDISLQGSIVTVTLTSTGERWTDISSQAIHHFRLGSR